MDRTELSKNIVRGLAAYRELLVTHPQWRGKVTHLAFAYPSRHDLPEYREYTASVQRLAAEINDEFGTEDWDPLILQVNDDYARSLAAYRLADVLLVNPIRDGMNLVAKEGPILSDRGCALVLSREAGAAAELGADALLVNPYDITATAEALHEALIMPDAERRAPGGPAGRSAAARPSPPQPVVRRPAQRRWTRRARAQRAGQRAPAGRRPRRPVDDEVCSAASSADLAPTRCTPSGPGARPRAGPAPPRRPPGRPGRRRRTAPRPAFRSATRPVSAAPLSMPGGRSSMHQPPRLDDQPGVARPARPAARAARPARPPDPRRGGCARPARRPCPRSRCPSGAPAAASTPGSRARAAADARRGRRGGQHARPASAPGRTGRARSARGRRRTRRAPPPSAAGRPVITASVRPARRARASAAAAPGCARASARVGHDRRQRPVEVQSRSAPRPGSRRIAASPALPSAVRGTGIPPESARAITAVLAEH